MSFHYSPRVVRDPSLVLYLDAGNTKSYSGSGTNWLDITGNANNGTLTLGPIYNSGNNGSIGFDGTDDYVDLGVGSTLKPSVLTVSVWVKPGILNKAQFVFDGGYYGSIAGYLIYTNSTNNFMFWVRNSANNTQGVGVRSVTSTTTFNISSWYNVTGVFSGSNVYIYVNGVLENSGAMTNPITYNALSKFWIGNYSSVPSAASAFNGNVGILSLYNRVLSDSEILQNYNAIKPRYGL